MSQLFAALLSLTVLMALTARAASAQEDVFEVRSKERRDRATLSAILLDTQDADNEDTRIETDRREFTQSTTVIELGHFQLESGYTFFRRRRGEAHESSHTFPESLLRIGTGYATELRLSSNAAWQFANDEQRAGFEDFRFSLKTRLNDQDGLVPQAAGILKFSFPTGSHDWSTSHLECGAEYVFGWDIAETWQLYGSTGFSTNSRGDFAFAPEFPARERFLVFTQSLAIGRDLTKRVHGYAEVFGYFTHGLEHREINPVSFGVGTDYFVSDNFVIDTRFGVGLNHDADDFFVGTGAAFRF